MAQQSAGLLAYRTRGRRPEVLLVHPGGPFYRNKDSGAWSIPKGLFAPGEDALAAAKREFQEETGFAPDAVKTPDAAYLPLGEAKQPSGKVVHAWAVEADLDATRVVSNTFPLEWPPKSGQMQEFPEVDEAAWFSLEAAAEKILKGQQPFLERLIVALRD
jgi:predicted NUDIX family NTP pyrophosphohydrolase